MAKSREHVVTNGRAVFYACMWEDMRNADMDCGWALGLHGSLNSDMDIMAMPWVEGAKPVMEMLESIRDLFTDSCLINIVPSFEKPNNRVVFTMSIWADFYLDINVIGDYTREGKEVL